MTHNRFRYVTVLLALFAVETAHGADALPFPASLDELGGSVQTCATLEHMPALASLLGAVAAGRNVLSVTAATFPPLSQGGEALALSVNGAPVAAETSQWRAYEIRREGTAGALKARTTTRMADSGAGLLLTFTVENPTDTETEAAVSLSSRMIVRLHEGTWEWAPPRPDEKAQDHRAVPDGEDAVTWADSKSPAVTAMVMTPSPRSMDADDCLHWEERLAPGGSLTVRITVAFGTDRKETLHRAHGWLNGFNDQQEAARNGWETRFKDAFTPGSGRYSGHLPLLATDDPALHRVYYGSVLSWLCMERTGLSEKYPRVFVTASPFYAPTLTYFWDTQFYGTLWALLDPAGLKEQLRLFLTADIHSCYAVDFLTLKGVGPWYSANDYALFQGLTTYMRLNDDWGFLDEIVGEKNVLGHLESLATHWKKLADNPSGMADYGTKDNLLETVPTYTNVVPSFNAANVWMMRTLAGLLRERGRGEDAARLEEEAGVLAGRVLSLCNDLHGWFSCIMPDGRRQEVRSVVDFMTVAACMTKDVPPDLCGRMMDSVDRELWTGQWLRALSIEDPSAVRSLASPKIMATWSSAWPGDSLRADHGFTGSYTAWPAQVAEAFSRWGRDARALEMLRAVSPVLDEGPFGQSHYVPAPTRPVRKAFIGGQDYFEGCGGAFAEVILRHFCRVSSRTAQVSLCSSTAP